MEILLILIAVLALLSFILKCSFFPRWGAIAASLALAASAWAAIPWLTRQEASAFSSWVTDPDHMLDAAVCIVLEAVIMTAFCFSRPSGRFRTLRFYPGLLVFPAAVWILSRVLFSSPGMNFNRFAWVAALAVLFIALGGSRLMAKLVPEEDIRLEGLFLINLFLLLSSVAATGAITF
ncbi:MAG: hypothetical protein IKQ64_04905 [Bacteroidales bacterium]|nr:hypothetical protein [Bacteroidales bacterium]